MEDTLRESTPTPCVTKKFRASEIKIIVHESYEKPYYEIEWFDVDDKEWNTGFGSFDINSVFKWREDYFEIIKPEEEIESFRKDIAQLSTRIDALVRENKMMKDEIKKLKEDIDKLNGSSFYDQAKDSERISKIIGNMIKTLYGED